jgi:hypothetical protein
MGDSAAGEFERLLVAVDADAAACGAPVEGAGGGRRRYINIPLNVNKARG